MEADNFVSAIHRVESLISRAIKVENPPTNRLEIKRVIEKGFNINSIKGFPLRNFLVLSIN